MENIKKEKKKKAQRTPQTNKPTKTEGIPPPEILTFTIMLPDFVYVHIQTCAYLF